MNIDLANGSVLLVNKPLEWTSFDVVNKIRYAVTRYARNHPDIYEAIGKPKQIKVGHAGTLDPLATGLLVICIGKQTRNIDQYMATEKEYTGSFYLGATTPSYDKETAIDGEFPVDHITSEKIHAAAKQFLGETEQLPPMYSAIKKDGKKLYESARAGEEVERTARKIMISEFEITRVDMPLVYFRIVCSKGTYIRSIAYDFGKALGSGAHLASLCRTRSGAFVLNDAYTVEQVVEALQS